MGIPADEFGAPGDRDDSKPDGSEVRQHLVELQRTNRALRLLSDVNQVLVRVTSEDDLLQQACEIAVEIGGYRLAWVGFAEHDAGHTIRPICHAGDDQGYLHHMRFSWAECEDCRDPACRAIRTGEPIEEADIAAMSPDVPWRKAALAHGFRSIIAFPLRVENAVIGAFTLYSSDPGAVSPEEMHLLIELAGDLSYGITALRTRERQQQAEAALRASEEKFAKAFYTSPDAITITRLRDGIYLDANQGFTNITGYTRDEIIGKTAEAGGINIWVNSVDRQRLEAAIREHGVIVGLEAEFRRKDGQILTGSLSASRIELAGEKCLLSMTRDITDRRRAEEALRTSEEKFAKAFYTSPDALNINRLSDGVYLEVNEGFTRMTGYTREEAIGKNGLAAGLNIWVHPEDRQRMAEALRARGRITGMEAEFRRKDGRIITGSLSATQIELAGEQCLLAITRDITDRIIANRKIRESEERLSLIIRNSPDLFFILDTRLRYIWTPKTVLGLTPEEAVGLTDHDFFPPEEADRLDTINRQVMATGESIRYEKPLPTEYGTFYYENTASLWRDAEGRIAGVVVYAHDITERKQAEDALRANEALLRAVVDNAPFEFWARDLNECVIMENKALVEHWGEQQGKCPDDATIPPEVAALWQENNRRAFAGEIVKAEVEYEMRGQRYTFENIVAPIYQDSRLLGIMGFNIDITERKLAEEALRLTQFSVDRAADMIYWMDFDGHVLYVNDAACRRLGYSREELSRMTVFDIDPVFPRESWPQQSERLRREQSFIIETQHRTKQGECFPVEVSINYLQYNGKEYHFAFARDITERKRAEEAITRERTFLGSAIELLPFPILFIAPSLEMIRQNRAGLELQRTPDTVPLGGVDFLDPQTFMPLPRQEWPIVHALQGEAMPTREFILRQHDGREIPILLQTAPIFIDDELVAAVVAIQDITAVKEADRAKNQFLMVLSHEVKTPLTSIIGWTQLAQSAPDIVPDALAAILHNAQMQKLMLERLLILSRILTGKLELARQSIDLWQLALSALANVQHAATEHHLTTRLAPPHHALTVDVDKKLLTQAIGELLDNALHYTPDGGTISLQGRREREEVVLTIRDTGQGITPEQLPTLLTPLTQLQRKEEIGGLGIGLALTRGIVKAHGGRMEISSLGSGQGTTVVLRLPRAEDDERARETGKTSREEPAP